LTLRSENRFESSFELFQAGSVFSTIFQAFPSAFSNMVTKYIAKTKIAIALAVVAF